MQFYISHLVDTDHFLKLLEKYPVGIESINFSVSNILDEGPSALSRYKAELGSILTQRPLILHGPFFDLSPASFDSQIKRVTLERFESVYKIAEELGATKIVFHSGFIPQIYYIEGWLQNSILFWKTFMEDKDTKITLCIENVFEDQFKPLANLIEAVNHPAFKCCLDVGHVNAYSSLPLKSWIEGLTPHLSHIHLHNNEGLKDDHYGLLRGTLCIKDCLHQIQQLSPNATVTLEVYDTKELTDSLSYLSTLQFLSANL